MHGGKEGEGVAGVFLEAGYCGGLSVCVWAGRGKNEGLTVIYSAMAIIEATQTERTNSVVGGWDFIGKIGKLLVEV